ncbi:hypothetical protein AQ616_17885 [Oceanobacillus sp. E9]|uniref:hypothetical protein n=1 Tax=Oceanobacillus TaxID=182709 RepID=UPI00034611CA|nr:MULTISPECIES: hypothetical protein [Oceanobacillus]OEH53151.1 hypothetical protein AQ616_17885 [Oceanobacillus sp. E9]
MLKKYLISFREEDLNNESLDNAIRSRIEHLSPKTWFQIFPNLILIQSDLSIGKILAEIETICQNKRTVITEISDCVTNEEPLNDALKEYGY